MKININNSNYDLESYDSLQLSNIEKTVIDFDISRGYTRNDLESLENMIPGIFTDLEDFNFNEYPSTPSKVNFHIVERKLKQLKDELSDTLNSKHKHYVEIYGKTIKELNSIKDLLIRVKDYTPNPIISDLNSVMVYSNEFDGVFISDCIYSNSNIIPKYIRELADVTLNGRIMEYNYLVDSIEEPDLIDNRNEFNYTILKEVLGISEIKYDSVMNLLSNPNKLEEFIDKTITMLISTLTEVKELLSYRYIESDITQNRWISIASNLEKFTPIANDKLSLFLIRVLALFKYGKI